MIYKQEVGILVNQHNKILHLIKGTSGSVDFPPELVWKLHKESPGIILAFVHLHPPKMYGLSGLDEELLKGWSIAFHPFPIRLTVIAESHNYTFSAKQTIFRETCWFGNLESKEEWINRGKEGTRKFEIIKEWERSYTYTNDDMHYKDKDYISTVIEQGYDFDLTIQS